VSTHEAEVVAREHGMTYFETSAKKALGVEEAFRCIAEQVVERLCWERIPASVRTSLTDAGVSLDRFGSVVLPSGPHAADGARGDTLLQTTARVGAVGPIVDLLRAGADVHAINKAGDTALHFASSHGHVDAVRALLEAGAKPDVRNKDGVLFGKRPIDVVSPSVT